MIMIKGVESALLSERAARQQYPNALKTLIDIERHTVRHQIGRSSFSIEIFVIFRTSCSRNLCNVIKKAEMVGAKCVCNHNKIRK